MEHGAEDWLQIPEPGRGLNTGLRLHVLGLPHHRCAGPHGRTVRLPARPASALVSFSLLLFATPPTPSALQPSSVVALTYSGQHSSLVSTPLLSVLSSGQHSLLFPPPHPQLPPTTGQNPPVVPPPPPPS